MPEAAPALRRQASLPAGDVAYLDGLGLPWEVLAVGNVLWLVVHDHPLPPGYTAGTTSVAVRLLPGYPTTALDMAYFYPHLQRADGRAIQRAQIRQALDGETWQGWSRHRPRSNPWQPGVDSFKTHHALIEAWLAKETRR